MSLATVKARILDDGTRKRLNAAADACAGKSARLEEGFRLAGVRFLRDTQREFKKLSRRERRGWKKLSPVTVLQRRRGRGKKIEDWDDIERRRSEIAILNDSGRLAASLSPGATGNVLKVKRLSVECGTNVSYADTHQRGKRSTFEFDEGQFEKNVKKILPGKKPKKTASGKKSRAKRNWNTMYFVARNWLRRLDGKRFKVPKRVIIRKPTRAQVAQYVAPITRAINAVLRGRAQ